MTKTIIQEERVILNCDYCGKEIISIAAEITFGYGSNYDFEGYIFCSDACLKSWCNENIN